MTPMGPIKDEEPGTKADSSAALRNDKQERCGMTNRGNDGDSELGSA